MTRQNRDWKTISHDEDNNHPKDNFYCGSQDLVSCGRGHTFGVRDDGNGDSKVRGGGQVIGGSGELSGGS